MNVYYSLEILPYIHICSYVYVYIHTHLHVGGVCPCIYLYLGKTKVPTIGNILFFIFGREATFLTYLVLQRMTHNCLNKNFRKKNVQGKH